MTGSGEGRAVSRVEKTDPVVQAIVDTMKIVQRLRDLKPIQTPLRATREWDRVRRIAYL
jgi:hypothetical protein